MKFSIKWLQQFVKFGDSADELAAKLTSIGLEVESVEEDVIDVSVAPNRADCLGILGIAREAASANNIIFNPPKIKPISGVIKDKLKVQVDDNHACPKYLSRIIKDVNVTAKTPEYIENCLKDADINLINPVVDITNYVMLETGQPLHAFDLSTIDSQIVVRKAKDKEFLTLLDDSKIEMTSSDLVIADAKKPLALAGIMGGKSSGVSEQTKDLLLECAYFEAVAIRLSARNHGIQTESSFRFERCIDPSMQETVIERLTALLLEVVGGKPGDVVSTLSQADIPKTKEITLRKPRVSKILGVKDDDIPIAKILTNLGMDIVEKGEEFKVKIPGFREDISLEIDLIEEIARIYGLDNIPSIPCFGALKFKPRSETIADEATIKNCMVNRGYSEVITYSFISSELAAKFSDKQVNHEQVLLTNPISADMDIMRPSLLPGLVNTIVHNLNHQQKRVRIFETGLRFVPAEEHVQQIDTIAGACCGNFLPEGWENKERNVNFYDIKSDVIALGSLVNVANDLVFMPGEHPAMHPEQCAKILVKDQQIGFAGALHPELQKKLGIESKVFVFELDCKFLISGKVVKYRSFSKYPSVRRDLAMLLDTHIPVANLENEIKRNVGDLLKDLVIFDVYKGKGVPDGLKSVGVGITLQHPARTLTDNEANEVFERVINMLSEEFNAKLR